MKLYHYTCAHEVSEIRASGLLRPWPQPMLGDVALVWLTDLDVADRAALGLTSKTLRCDRTAHRVTVETFHAEHWPEFAHRLPHDRRRPLELAPGALPMHWWVVLSPVRVVKVSDVAS